jgi:drug/metabolite transporter (DMT)-like permease
MLARLAPLLFVLLWSSSFIAAKTGLRHLAPLLFVAIRLAGCAVVLTGLMFILRCSWQSLAGWQWLHCAVVRFCRGVPLLAGATAQFLSAAIVAALGVWLLEAPHADWSGAAIASVVWNTVVVSLGGMGRYFAMLARGTAARTTANFYLVPGTAVVLALALLGERLSGFAVLGLVVASTGCWLVNAAPATPASTQARKHATLRQRADLCCGRLDVAQNSTRRDGGYPGWR